MFLTILGASLLASIADLSGLFLFWRKGWAKKHSHLMVSFAAGTLLGAAFLELLPETLEAGGNLAAVLGGILFFYLVERILFLYHCHDEHCEVHTSPWLMLIGNTLHDFIDGIIIALTFLLDPGLGFLTVIAVVAHEFPSGIGEFSVLIHGGFKDRQALLYTVLTILATPFGALLTFFLAPQLAPFTGTLLALATGGFIYIAAVDLIPETHRESNRLRSVVQGFLLLLGIFVIYFLGVWLE